MAEQNAQLGIVDDYGGYQWQPLSRWPHFGKGDDVYEYSEPTSNTASVVELFEKQVPIYERIDWDNGRVLVNNEEIRFLDDFNEEMQKHYDYEAEEDRLWQEYKADPDYDKYRLMSGDGYEHWRYDKGYRSHPVPPPKPPVYDEDEKEWMRLNPGVEPGGDAYWEWLQQKQLDIHGPIPDYLHEFEKKYKQEWPHYNDLRIPDNDDHFWEWLSEQEGVPLPDWWDEEENEKRDVPFNMDEGSQLAPNMDKPGGGLADKILQGLGGAMASQAGASAPQIALMRLLVGKMKRGR